jgi:hypothetical protein
MARVRKAVVNGRCSGPGSDWGHGCDAGRGGGSCEGYGNGCYSGSGDGDGYGHGHGDGDGYGYGDGTGNGSGWLIIPTRNGDIVTIGCKSMTIDAWLGPTGAEVARKNNVSESDQEDYRALLESWQPWRVRKAVVNGPASGSGFGWGHGCDAGSGSGDGAGYGDGIAYYSGDGVGPGYGDGTGNGDGTGHGYGEGDGYGGDGTGNSAGWYGLPARNGEFVTIGCRSMTIDAWLGPLGEEVARKNNVSDSNQEDYRALLESWRLAGGAP